MGDKKFARLVGVAVEPGTDQTQNSADKQINNRLIKCPMGKMKKMIDELIHQKAKGNSFQELNIQMKLLFKGIDVKKITNEIPDDPVVIAKIYEVASDFQITLTNV